MRDIPMHVCPASVCYGPPGLKGQALLAPALAVVGNYAIAAPCRLYFTAIF